MWTKSLSLSLKSQVSTTPSLTVTTPPLHVNSTITLSSELHQETTASKMMLRFGFIKMIEGPKEQQRKKLKIIATSNHFSISYAEAPSRYRRVVSEIVSPLKATLILQNPFEISNSTPFEELFPRHSTPDHSLQHVVNQFLRMDTPSSRTLTSSAPFTTIPMSFSQQIPSSTIPPPIITTSIITHTTKGKGIALPTSSPPHSPCTRPTGLVINEPRSQSSPASSVGTRRHYTRQSAQIGDSEYQDAQHLSTASPSSKPPSSPEVDQLLHEDTPALFMDVALNLEEAATGLGLVFTHGLSPILKSAKIYKSGASTPIFAEAQALYEGIQWCMSSQLNPRFIFSDCLNLVTKVNGNWQDYSSLSTLIQKIRFSFSSFPEASLLHLPHQLNNNAHSLAKAAFRLRDEDLEDSF
ncbi:hypothetical protein G4B88_000733 [Cannabis sativa]|uniref:RNase H type-1 domain-containing protein n=1 Tax=Cannabis sativa TaxID=3483 RepID=A0A7J6I388_CANSA|nr:hypothetical protein G4B88_000733 [Cannabis sativa]